MKAGFRIAALIVGLLAPLHAQVSFAQQPATELYFVDAHSQVGDGLNVAKIIPLMDQAGVRHTILAARNNRTPQEILSFAAQNPDRVTPAVRAKGRALSELDKQLAEPGFKAMAEFLMYHAEKGKKAPEAVFMPDSAEVRMYLDAAVKRGWPFIVHIEFESAGFRRSQFMEKFEAMASGHPDVPFALIHMGQLEPPDARRLIEKHPNVHFLTSHSNPISKANGGKQPWINMFTGSELSVAWRELIVARPDRFILAFDNVWPEHWGSFYLEQAALWRKALARLPSDVAHKVAHGNAERLWKLPVAQ